ncbi:tetratricopeptide repeat protein [Bacillus timonensis]|nr:tetratricopeptide repeat protein [Bacillus timonensis]
MEEQLLRAIELRKVEAYEESNQLLRKLVMEQPNDPFIHYQCAWSYDVMGEESKAVPFYEKAIQLGLSGSDLEGALLGLGSTYRTLEEYEKSKKTLMKGMELFPQNNAIKVFYAMTLYNSKEHESAMEVLLTCLTETTNDKEILRYKKAIDFYRSRLDEVWR